jgi:cold shock CspA family protein
MSGKTEIGKVKFFDANRGFGFLERVDGGLDVFVGRGSLPYGVTLTEGQTVSFIEKRDEKRNKTFASEVQPLEPADVESRYED